MLTFDVSQRTNEILATILTPVEYLGGVLEEVLSRRGEEWVEGRTNGAGDAGGAESEESALDAFAHLPDESDAQVVVGSRWRLMLLALASAMALASAFGVGRRGGVVISAFAFFF